MDYSRRWKCDAMQFGQGRLANRATRISRECTPAVLYATCSHEMGYRAFWRRISRVREIRRSAANIPNISASVQHHLDATDRSRAAFEKPGGALAAADAHGHDAVAHFSAKHFVGDCPDQAGAGHAVGMADGDGAAVDIQFFGIDAQAVAAVDNLHGERLVKFPQVDVVDFEAVALE